MAQMFWLALLLLLVAIALFAPPVARLLGEGTAVREEVATRFLMMHNVIWPVLIAFFLMAALVTLRLTHKVAGPLCRFRNVFADVTRGVLTMRVRTREGDYLTSEAALLDQMVVAIRNRVVTAKAELAQVVSEVQLLEASGRPTTPGDLAHLRHALARTQATLDGFETESASAGASPAVAPVALPAVPRTEPGYRQQGFTLLEVMLVTMTIGVLASIAMPAYNSALNLARITKAVADLRTVDRLVRLHIITNGCMPSTLAQIGQGDLRDPWGRPYVYGVLPQSGGGPGKSGGTTCPACAGGCITQGAARKDKKLVPINSDFDVYSLGLDGLSAAALTAKVSADDVVRGSNGSFFGLGKAY